MLGKLVKNKIITRYFSDTGQFTAVNKRYALYILTHGKPQYSEPVQQYVFPWQDYYYVKEMFQTRIEGYLKNGL